MKNGKFSLATIFSPELLKYFILAVALVVTEVALFQGMVLAGTSYVAATPLSMAIVVLMNWYLSGAFVFKARPHSRRKELLLVVIASAVGIIIQLSITVTAVEILRTSPLVGKIAAIGVTFFWNFWFRKKYIFFEE